MSNKKIIAVGTTDNARGQLFSPINDFISIDVQDAFERAGDVGLDRQDFARLALLCLDEACGTFDRAQIKAVDTVRQLLIDSGMYTPLPVPRKIPAGLPPGSGYRIVEDSDGTWDAYRPGGLWATNLKTADDARQSLWEEYNARSE